MTKFSNRQSVTFSLLGFCAILFAFNVPISVWLMMESKGEQILLATPTVKLIFTVAENIYLIILTTIVAADCRQKNFRRSLSYVSGLIAGAIALVLIYGVVSNDLNKSIRDY